MIRTAGAVAALAVAVAVAACAPLQMGAAAIVGTQRISTSSLSGDVASLNDVYQAHPNLRANVQYTPKQMPRLVLMWLVRFRIFDDIARRYGVQVSDADAERALAQAHLQAERQIGGPVSTDEFSLLTATPPNLAAKYGRFEAVIEKLALFFTGAKNVSSITQAQQQQFAARISAEVAVAVKRLNIKVNPRFGRFDARQLTIVAAPDRLSRAA